MHFEPSSGNFYLNNRMLDLTSMQWNLVSDIPQNLITLTTSEAIRKLQSSINKIKIPIGVIGTNSPDSEQYRIANELGKTLASLGLTVLCGGRAGIMEAVCRGVHDKGGTSIGLLPENNLSNANKFVTIPLATGIGFARNSIIALASLCLVAIGGGYGTLSEIASGMQFGKNVLIINCTLKVEKTITCNNVQEIIDNIYKIIFNIDHKDNLPIT
jgi:hypothetical protein